MRRSEPNGPRWPLLTRLSPCGHSNGHLPPEAPVRPIQPSWGPADATTKEVMPR